MKPVTSNFGLHAASPVTNIVTCWKLKLTDGRVQGFTSCTEELTVDGVAYHPKTGTSISGIETTNSLSVDNLDVSGTINSLDIKEEDILSGKYDFAEIEVFSVNASDTREKVTERHGWLGEVTVRQGQFVAEVRGLTQKLQCNIGELYSPLCRATFGDGCCKADLKQYTFAGTVQSISSSQVFTAVMDKPDGYFTCGEIKWVSGGNLGLRMEIKEFFGNQFVLVLPMPHEIKAGDKFEAVAGCDKAFGTCCNKFRNAVNFRGEPHVPGQDKMLETPSTTDDLKRG